VIAMSRPKPSASHTDRPALELIIEARRLLERFEREWDSALPEEAAGSFSQDTSVCNLAVPTATAAA
jgi:hypothetical protein